MCSKVVNVNLRRNLTDLRKSLENNQSKIRFQENYNGKNGLQDYSDNIVFLALFLCGDSFILCFPAPLDLQAATPSAQLLLFFIYC